jgi:uncharacterized membrane protein HdeD (DUF308 family)
MVKAMSEKSLGTRWTGYLYLGLALIAGGIAAMLLPDYSNYATSTILGGVLLAVGLLTVWHAFASPEWHGFSMELLKGAAEAAGGILIILNPMKGAAALTLVVAIVLVAQGLVQGGLAFRIRPQGGWRMLLVSAAVSVLVGLALMLRFPFDLVEEPGAMVGVALVAGGLAYLVMAYARRSSGAAQ